MNGYQFIIAVVASCGGLLFGYEIGMMNVVLIMDAFRIYFGLYRWDGGKVTNEKGDSISEEYTIDKTPMYRRLLEDDKKPYIEGFITSTFTFGAIFGAILSSFLAKKFSSQRIIMISAAVFAVGSFVQGSSLRTITFLSLRRMISGLAVGCISVLCPTYVVEVAPARIRNIVISCYEMMIALGIVLAAVINSFIWYSTNVRPTDVVKEGMEYSKGDNGTVNNKEWRIAFYLQLIPSLLMAILLLFLPNSPRWLCTKVRDDEALEVLAKLNSTSKSDYLVQEELKALQCGVSYINSLGHTSYKELLNQYNRRRSFTSFFMQFFQQWTGMNGILYYQSQLFSGVGFSKIISTITLPIINNSIYFISTLIGMWNIQKIGRKSLLVTGSLLLFILGVGVSISSHHTMDHIKYRLAEPIDCSKEMNEWSYYSPSSGTTFYGNNCHKIVHQCDDHRNVISFDEMKQPFTPEEGHAVCSQMDALRYASGQTRRTIFVGCIFLFTFIYACTWGPVPKVYQAEIFPIRMRVIGTTFNAVSHFISSWTVVFFTPMLILFWGMRIFYLFSAACFLALIFSVFCCIESKGLSLEEIDEEMGIQA